MTKPSERGRIAPTDLARRVWSGATQLGRRLRSTATRSWARRVVAGLLVVLVVLAGAWLGLLVGARTVGEVGPFRAQFAVDPAVDGESSLYIPPLGSLHLDTHEGPAHLSVHLGALDQARTQQMITDPGGVTRATETVADDLIDGVIRVGLGGMGAAVLGAMALAALVFRDTRRVAWSGGLALAVVIGSYGLAAGTFRIEAVEEPRYEGLLVHAPALVGDVQRIADEYERYTEQLQSMVSNISTLYTAASSVEGFQPDGTMTRVLHVADLHLNPAAWSIMRTVSEQYDVDFIIDSGDITDWGSGPETQYLTSIRLMRVPYVWVRGNHDSEDDIQPTVAEQPNAIVLDDEVANVEGLTVAGIGDPRFTPDQETGPFTEEEAALIEQQVALSGATLANTIREHGEPVDIAVVHDPVAAEHLEGAVPLVLAGHRHERSVAPLAASQAQEDQQPADGELAGGEAAAETVTDLDGTLLMVQGSTGGAGLRGLEGEEPEPLAMSVLYFNAERQLVAYDDIMVGGHGLSEASVQRHLLDLPPENFDPSEARNGEPTPGTSPSPGS